MYAPPKLWFRDSRKRMPRSSYRNRALNIFFDSRIALSLLISDEPSSRLDVHVELRLRGREPVDSLNSGFRASGIRNNLSVHVHALGSHKRNLRLQSLQNFVREEPDAYP